MVTIAPEQAGAIDAIAALGSRGVVASLGHSSADFLAATAAADAGARMVTHLFNGMGPLHHRTPGLAGAGLVDDRLVAGIIADLVHVHPALLTTAFRVKRGRGIALVTDAVAWRSPHLTGQLDVSLVDGAPRLADGTLAGSCLTMDQAIRNVVTTVGVDLVDAIHAAATTPADVLGATRPRPHRRRRPSRPRGTGRRLCVRRTVVGGVTVWAR